MRISSVQPWSLMWVADSQKKSGDAFSPPPLSSMTASNWMLCAVTWNSYAVWPSFLVSRNSPPKSAFPWGHRHEKFQRSEGAVRA